MYSRTGSQAYANVGLESSVMSASPHQLITLLFDGAHSALARAKILMNQGDIAGKGNALSKAIDIINNGLKAGLDMEKGGELAENLSALYDYMTQRLTIANLHNDVQVIDEVNTLLANIADAWRQINPQQQAVSSGVA
ncbi:MULTISPECIES: flagellar export chaperone FliS [unclassified Symbiopectobacterium]|uniref:flagellar export chaperone FliS n=1 Tax=unclassified Symbiopectobacterium TaxID=2794573 RepID=UPI002226DB4B|nr:MULTISPECIES: flagellar export chaperone FliS [unclassified Symbiopectobacterium]MCW2474365.1 flagellar export chaperone FliS [Candidatus Symbiopectobacterium sp. NZEC151]MCW2483592.1 flagellar export chaperone FliS [Candidatus Symbiopectobacterium sp. NZEC135]MCW2485606.1 flagellar export chaperone FliS [Candidatus Symbiopectobacterium sp. NZEC127]